MKIHIVIDLVYGAEGSPGIRAFRSEASAIAEKARLTTENAGDENYLVVRDTAELED